MSTPLLERRDFNACGAEEHADLTADPHNSADPPSSTAELMSTSGRDSRL